MVQSEAVSVHGFIYLGLDDVGVHCTVNTPLDVINLNNCVGFGTHGREV